MASAAKENALGRLVSISEIICIPDIQIRFAVAESTVKEYAAQVKEGVEFDPISLVRDVEGRLIMADGFHRLGAYQLAGCDKIPARIDEDHPKEALSYALEIALARNCRHGRTMSVKERRMAVRKALSDKRLARWSDKKLAQHCGVSAGLVAQIRAGDEPKPKVREETTTVSEHERALPTTHEPEPEVSEEITILRKWIKDGRMDWPTAAEIFETKKARPALLPKAPTLIDLKSGDKLVGQHNAVVTVDKGKVTIQIEEEAE